MKPEDKDLLKQELAKYNSIKNYKNDKVRSWDLNLLVNVEDAFQDKKEGMRLLIQNEYGLLGNLIFKYVRSGDEEIAELIEELDTKLVRDAYEKYGSKLLTNGSGYGRFGLVILLNDHPELVSLLSNDSYSGELALAVVERCPRIMEKVALKVKRNREFIKKMVRINGACFEWVDWKFRSDDELAYMAVRSCPEMIKCVDIKYRRDRDLFLHVVKHNGMLLFYADEDFRDDVEMVKAAVLSNKLALRYASERIQKMFEERDKRRGKIGNHRKRNEDQQEDTLVEYADERL